ncbi:MAG: hypothetical protein U9R02_00235 [Thermodesulfobacteriota bacterium]|nr:hypothetical protein [Thermodesulfobacteriota bacterium]
MPKIPRDKNLTGQTDTDFNINKLDEILSQLTLLRVRQRISSQFQVLRRSADKARKSMNIKHIQNFRNAVRRDASAPEM